MTVYNVPRAGLLPAAEKYAVATFSPHGQIGRDTQLVSLVLGIIVAIAIPGAIAYLFVRQNRERAGNAPLREEIEARVSLRTPLSGASVLGTGGLGGTRGVWIVITGRAGHRQVRLGITRDHLPEIWQALAGTGVSLVPAADELEPLGKPAHGVGRLTGWRRVAVTAAAVAAMPFIPAMLLFVARHLR
jgi:hypothetical protein